MSTINLPGDLTAPVQLTGDSSSNPGSTFNLGTPGNVIDLSGYFVDDPRAIISITDQNATELTTINLNYSSINLNSILMRPFGTTPNSFNITTSADLKISGGGIGDFNNHNDFNITSNGAIDATLGNGNGQFSDTFMFGINNSSSTSPANVTFNFNSYSISGTYNTYGSIYIATQMNLNLADNSTVIFQVGSGGFFISPDSTFNSASGTALNITSGSGTTVTFDGTGTFTNEGSVIIDHASVVINIPVSDPLGGHLATQYLPDRGDFTLKSASLTLGGGAPTGTGSIFQFKGGNNTLIVPGDDFKGAIRGFLRGDVLNTGIVGTPSYESSTGLLTITDADGTAHHFDVGTGYSASDWHDNSGVVTYSGPPPVVCYVTGTLIRTIGGDVPIERLKPGDLVVTAAGRQCRIVWTGHKKMDFSTASERRSCNPYRIRAHAFGPSLPSRDLWLSPDHAVAVSCLSDVLIPIKHLDNGATIAQVPVDDVTYWHIELEEHNLILAENLPAESFLNTSGRSFFGEADIERNKSLSSTRTSRSQVDLSPLKTWKGDACLPLITEGPVVTAIRAQLLERAKQLGWVLSDQPRLHFSAQEAEDELFVHALSETFYRLTFPAYAQAIKVSSLTFVPRHTDVETYDDRRLGVPLRRLDVHDSNGVRSIALDDPGLAGGFHAVQVWQGEFWRWTDGCGVIASSVWSEAIGSVTLDIELTRERGWTRTWIEPIPRSSVGVEIIKRYRAS